MGAPIEERVVEMRFDNKKFEQNAKETLSTLDRLKKALKLDGATKALEEVDKAAKSVSLDGLSSSVEFLEKRFSTMGIVGMRVIENLTDGFMNKLTHAVNFATDAIVSGGIRRAMNIENAHFQLQALLKDEAKVQAIMADAMESVDGTAYAYDEAAKAASQFAASGLQAGEEMLGALKGVTGVAAMTNSDFQSISQIFTTVSGQGRLMGDQLLQLASRGLNAASTLKDYFVEVRGQANMTEGEIRDMVSKGQLDFRTFAEAMTWAFGDSAKRANETFTGAMSNMKSALARIGAGFIQPFVEQEGVLVNLFNALRIKINDVKTTLVFDEQKSALSGLTKEADILVETVGKMTQNGAIDFTKFTNSILGSKKSEEELAEVTEILTQSFEEMQASGSVTDEMLRTFSKNGIQAKGAITEYLNGVMDGSIKTTKAVKDAVRELTGGAKATNLLVKKWADDGKLSVDLFTNAIVNSSGLVGSELELTSKSIEGLYKAVKETGYVTNDALLEFKRNGISAANALTKYLNGVSDGSIRATYATRMAVQELTDGSHLSVGAVRKLADEGKINFDIFQSAMENAFGDSRALSKQFTDYFQDVIATIVDFVENVDVTKPMELFYYWVEIVKNGFKTLGSFLGPILQALRASLSGFGIDNLIDFSAKIEEFTAKLRLSEKGSKNLRDAFKGLFDVIKLGIDLFFKLVGAIVPVTKPIGAVGDGVLGIVSGIGRMLSAFTSWIRNSVIIRKSFEIFSKVVKTAMDYLSLFIISIKDFAIRVYEMPAVQRLLKALADSFLSLGEKASPVMDKLMELMRKFKARMEVLIPDALAKSADWLAGKLEKLAISLKDFEFSDVTDGFKKLTEKLRDFYALIRSNEGVDTFLTNFENYIKRLVDAFTFEKLKENIEKFKTTITDFLSWLREILTPVVENFSLGETIAAGGGLGLIYALLKMSKGFQDAAAALKSIPSILGKIGNTLVEYQKNLKADSIKKIAAAILMIAGAMVILSFVDPDRLVIAAGAVAIIGAALFYGLSTISRAVESAKGIPDALNTLTSGIGDALNQLAKGAKWKMIGMAIKDLGKTLLYVLTGIALVAYMYSKDADSVMYAVDLMKEVFGAIMIIIVLCGVLGDLASGAFQDFRNVGVTVLMLCGGLMIAIMALEKLFGLTLPADADAKMIILGLIFGGLALLTYVAARAAKEASGSDMAFKTLLGMTALLYVAVLSISNLFKIKLDADWDKKLWILAGVFAGVALLILAMGAAQKVAGEGFNAAGTLLAMAVMIAVIVAALFVLTILPADKLLQGSLALGGILLALALALMGAGTISKPDTWKTVLSMALLVAVVASALTILAIIPLDALAKAAITLGVILGIIAADLAAAGYASKGKETWEVLVAMMGVVAVVCLGLAILAQMPWPNLLAGGTMLSLVLAALAGAFYVIGESKAQMKDALSFLVMAIPSILVIAISLAGIATRPWEAIYAAGTMLSLVISALAGTLFIMANSRPDLKALALFGAAIAEVVVVAAAIYFLAEQDWIALLAAGTALTMVIDALSVAMLVTVAAGTLAPAAITGMVLIGAMVTEFTIILAALGAIFQSDSAKQLLNGGAEILSQIGTAIGTFLGNIVEAFSVGVAGALENVGDGLKRFWENAKSFFDGMAGVDDKVYNGIKKMAAGILLLTAADLINGIASFITGGSDSWGKFGSDLASFWKNGEPFFKGAKNIDPKAMEGIKSLAQVVALLTAKDIVEGATKWFTGGNSLGKFGEELVAFGPSIAAFSEIVKDVKKEQVEGAANAAKIIGEVYDALPESGGLAQKIFGEKKNLSDFGAELLLFGPSLASFAVIVKDVTPEMVQGAKEAAEIMSGLYDVLPNVDGLAQMIFGSQKNLSEFGDELAEFGPDIVKFAEDVEGVNPDSVRGAEAIGYIMAALAKALPESSSWWSDTFGGGTITLDDFGSQLRKFGQSMRSFSDNAQKVNAEQFSKVVTTLVDLVEIADILSDMDDLDALSDFAEGLENVGTGFVNNFIEAFEGSEAIVRDGISVMLTTAINVINEQEETFSVSGQNAVNAWVAAFESKITKTKVAITLLSFIGAILTILENKLSDFTQNGIDATNAYFSGFEIQQSKAGAVGNAVASQVLSGLRGLYGAFFSAGSDAIQGFIDGIRSKTWAAANAGAALGNAVYEAARKALDEHSPSKKMGEVGEYAGLGFVNRLLTFVTTAGKVGKEMGDEVVENAVYAVNQFSDEIFQNLNPEIHPIVDLSDVENSFGQIKSMFNDSVQKMSVELDDISSVVNRSQNDSNDVTEEIPKEKSGTSVTMIQNNYSPKALSRIDIYRNTNNQISRLERRLQESNA